MREVLETYKPNLLTRRRRLIEDFVRDLMLNNDHIHVVEQQMRWDRSRDLNIFNIHVSGKQSSVVCKERKMPLSDVSPLLSRFEQSSWVGREENYLLLTSGAAQGLREGKIPLT